MAPALGLGALLGVLGLLRTPAGAAEVVHSLRYLRVAVSEPGPGLPRYVAVASVDGTPFVRYDSERGRLEPQTLWMAAGAEPGYWDTESRINGRYQRKDPAHLDMLQIRHNQSGGLHTLQRDCGCELLSDGSVRGSYREGYDGQDFLSFQLGSRSFVAADGAAQIIKRHWDSDGITVERLTNFLEQTCLEVLQKHVQYGQEVLKKKEPPDVQVSGKEEHGILTLSCRAYGFYPGVIEINWLKGDEIWDQETWWGGIVPNSDGTFHSWARIEALPGEREQYRCRVEHAGMPEPGIFAWVPSPFSPSRAFQSRNLAGISSHWWSQCPSSLPSSSSVSSSWDLASGSSDLGRGRGRDALRPMEQTWELTAPRQESPPE
ncbi:class I histocompatibility antigen, F10 alpha chain-like isoform X5 [Chiroxiphia lanceolata]|uniref:class I histocompatibility antigen, F10 alpha chain-like isoform X5 n=1 Tax=Chiroxiphia lanceolata TaxID=296741 RepID=UPI0013CECC36|nr:class I histocompatibility antigen, F10 alpha chain-like isoform X5 [Chiroxiphia lanceolata]